MEKDVSVCVCGFIHTHTHTHRRRRSDRAWTSLSRSETDFTNFTMGCRYE